MLGRPNIVVMAEPLTIALITLGDPNKLTGGYLYHRRLVERAAHHNARLEFISVPERPFPLAILDARSVLREALRLKPQALVIDSIVAAYLGPVLSIRRPELPIIGMLHQPPGGIDYGPTRSAVQAWLDRLTYRRLGRLLVASESLADELKALGLPDEKLYVVPPGRDVAPYAVVPGEDLRRGRRVAFLCVANWIERKGIRSLLDAFARLPKDAATLHFAGDDNADPHYAARIRERIRKPDLTERVIVHGPLPIEEVAELYAEADAFVLPSLKEPYGTVYGEAMAYGLPVVGWRAGNLPYLADHEREGLIVEPGDTDGLDEALKRLAHDEPLRERLGEAARERALARPTWDESAALFFRLAREVVEQGS